jgi:hypothetical protein
LEEMVEKVRGRVLVSSWEEKRGRDVGLAVLSRLEASVRDRGVLSRVLRSVVISAAKAMY